MVVMEMKTGGRKGGRKKAMKMPIPESHKSCLVGVLYLEEYVFYIPIPLMVVWWEAISDNLQPQIALHSGGTFILLACISIIDHAQAFLRSLLIQLSGI